MRLSIRTLLGFFCDFGVSLDVAVKDVFLGIAQMVDRVEQGRPVSVFLSYFLIRRCVEVR